MKTIKKIVLFFILLIIISCEKEENEQSKIENEAVIEAYLYEGNSVTEIKLTELIPFEDLGTDKSPTVSDAEIKMLIDGNEFVLQEKPEKPGYYTIDDTNTLIQSKQEINLQLWYNNKWVTARTIVPTKPQNVQINESQKYVEEITSIWDLSQLADISVEVSWANPDKSYHYVTVKNLESNPETIDPYDYIPDIESFDFPPVSNDYSVIRFNQLNYYGTYEIVVHKVNMEYVDLYNSQNQDSRTLNEPLTNVENGYGIFTAFATDTVYLELLRP